jgi:mannose-1-phosphate guanylyltransferase
MSATNLYAVIMAGGSGTRFWPASRRTRPKQFLPIAGDLPMIVETHRRLEGLVPDERILVVAGEAHVPLVRSALPTLPVENLLAEPVGRNTAPCVALAAFEIQRRAPDSVQAILPADHVIRPAEAFRASLRAAAVEAWENEHLLTFGIEPTFPATGYGYIEAGAIVREVHGIPVRAVARFVEKPDEDRARAFIASGKFFWNGGIFVWRTSTILDELAAHLPALHHALASADPRRLGAVYPRLRGEAIDTGVMEKSARVRMLPIPYEWSDVGSWTALPDVHGRDAAGNCVAGDTELVVEDARDCIVYGEDGRLTALLGVSDLIVVHTQDATLVCPRSRAQDVRRIVAALEARESDRL